MQSSLLKIITVALALAVTLAHASISREQHLDANPRGSSGDDFDPSKLPPYAYAYTDTQCTEGSSALMQDAVAGTLDTKYHSFKPIVDNAIGCSNADCYKGNKKNCQHLTANTCFASTDPKHLCVDFRETPCNDQYPCSNGGH